MGCGWVVAASAASGAEFRVWAARQTPLVPTTRGFGPVTFAVRDFTYGACIARSGNSGGDIKDDFAQ